MARVFQIVTFNSVLPDELDEQLLQMHKTDNPFWFCLDYEFDSSSNYDADSASSPTHMEQT
jgi:hypothetical protein